jgi:hypothetical protein
VFTSYANLEARLIINKCKLIGADTEQKRGYVKNLYRDEEIKTLVLYK